MCDVLRDDVIGGTEGQVCVSRWREGIMMLDGRRLMAEGVLKHWNHGFTEIRKARRNNTRAYKILL